MISKLDDGSPEDPIHGRNDVLRLLQKRRSVRAYLAREVPVDLVKRLIEVSGRAPSGSNIQPWHVHVVTGPAKDRLTAEIMEHRRQHPGEPKPEYQYYPEIWPEPYLGRRRSLGWSLYGLLGIAKGDREAARRWHDLNFSFFGAPVGLVFTLDRGLEKGAFIDLGTFLQSLAIGARAAGLETCMQAAFASYHAIIRKSLAVPDDHIVACGMALGYEDVDAPQAEFRTNRVPLSDYVVFHED